MMKFLLCLLIILPASALASDPGSRLWATGGVTTIEGSAGGGLVPWALLSGYASDQEWGGTVNLSQARVDDYTLDVQAASVNWQNRVEVSVARQTLDLDTLGFILEDGFGLTEDELKQTILGLKVRLLGDALYRPWGQWSLGLQYKRQQDFVVPETIGARDDEGIDVYLSASKLLFARALGHNLLINGTLRATRANQGGLLGFGGDRNNGYELMAEVAAGVFLNRQWLVGAEYRRMPDNLAFAEQQDWWDLYAAWIPDRRLTVTAAWVHLGDVATLSNQDGIYLAIEGSF
ncbi:DUF3034 family protein [Marinobacter sp. VGCF2001]|uniref:DUF3034 family protein n=1 Tax=Marinobacter sp. VGCF2001 TaxID=3417189 RepID=UPI003CF8EE73